jgi:hypothetical protein
MNKIPELIVESQKEKDICAEIEKLRQQLLQERHFNEIAQKYKFKKLVDKCFIEYHEGELTTERIDFIKIISFNEKSTSFEAIIVSGQFSCVGNRNYHIQIRYMNPDDFYDLDEISNKKFETALKVVKMLMKGEVIHEVSQWKKIWKGQLRIGIANPKERKKTIQKFRKICNH